VIENIQNKNNFFWSMFFSNRRENMQGGRVFLLVALALGTLACYRELFRLKEWSLMDYKPYNFHDCTYNQTELERFEKIVHDGLANGLLNKKCKEDGLCFVKYGNRDIALFKPEKEERSRFGGLYMAETLFKGLDGLLYEPMHLSNGSKKQELVTKFDYGNFSCLPKGITTYMTTSKGQELVYLQEYAPSSGELAIHYGPAYSREFPTLNEAPLNEFQKMLILDFIFGNIDRHTKNVLVQQKPGDQPRAF
jgi:hypothetical protein